MSKNVKQNPKLSKLPTPHKSNLLSGKNATKVLPGSLIGPKPTKKG